MFAQILWLFLFLVGHLSLHLAFYNRINATGLRRWVIKLVERTLAVEALIILIFVAWLVIQSRPFPQALVLYGNFCAMALVIAIPFWIADRPVVGRGWLKVSGTTEVFRTPDFLDPPPAATFKSRLNLSIPGNQIFELAVERKQLPVHGMPDSMHGLKLAHFSDVHLTGHASKSYYQFVVAEMMKWHPDLVCLTGDIIDKSHCIDWLADCFGAVQAPQGKYFILGNHDTRIQKADVIRDAMSNLGWTDVGGRIVQTEYNGSVLEICGNELPWFAPAPDVTADESAFRILLSHSPDQIQWARERGVQLMLAGHTHGGHGRLPWIGPLIAPSFYGSRFASGEFFLPPTTMHVTRGIFGTHLQRINCRPELSLLTLETSDAAD